MLALTATVKAVISVYETTSYYDFYSLFYSGNYIRLESRTSSIPHPKNHAHILIPPFVDASLGLASTQASRICVTIRNPPAKTPDVH